MNRKLLVVEERHSPMLQQRNSRGGTKIQAIRCPILIAQQGLDFLRAALLVSLYVAEIRNHASMDKESLSLCASLPVSCFAVGCFAHASSLHAVHSELVGML